MLDRCRHGLPASMLAPGVSLLLLTIFGCASTPATPISVRVSALVPHLTPLPETAETQSRGGISITLAPQPFVAGEVQSCSYGFATGFRLLIPDGVSRDTHERMVEYRFQGLSVMPEELNLLLTLRNQMDRVFRPAGSVVQFTTNGQVQGVEQVHYESFLSAMVVPRGEAQIRMGGPSLGALPDGTAFGVLLYDVPAETDDAGNVTRRENFEWYFSVSYERMSQVTERVPREVWVPNHLMREIAEPSGEGSWQIRPSDGRCLAGVVADAR